MNAHNGTHAAVIDIPERIRRKNMSARHSEKGGDRGRESRVMPRLMRERARSSAKLVRLKTSGMRK